MERMVGSEPAVAAHRTPLQLQLLQWSPRWQAKSLHHREAWRKLKRPCNVLRFRLNPRPPLLRV